MATTELGYRKEVPLMSGEEVLVVLLGKAGPILNGEKGKRLLVNNLFPGDGGVCWDDPIHPMVDGFKRFNDQLLREGVQLLADRLGCDLRREVNPQCFTKEDNGSPYFVEERIYPTKIIGVDLIRDRWFDGKVGVGGKFWKEQLWIRRVR